MGVGTGCAGSQPAIVDSFKPRRYHPQSVVSKKVWPLLNLSSVQTLTFVFYMTCSLVMLFVSDSLRGEYLDVFKQ